MTLGGRIFKKMDSFAGTLIGFFDPRNRVVAQLGYS
jgi:hypothetical protein